MSTWNFFLNGSAVRSINADVFDMEQKTNFFTFYIKISKYVIFFQSEVNAPVCGHSFIY